MNFRSRYILFIAALAFALTFNQVSSAEAKRVLITQKIQESNLVALTGNTRPEANKTNDRGAVADDLPLDHLMLQLRRPNELETALEQYIGQLHDSKSPNFHRWLTAAQGDIDTLTSWLRSQGFKVNGVYPTGTVIDFSGMAAEVEASFHTEIHNLDVNGVHQIANMSDPKIPAALASAVVGVVKLNSFMPHPMIKKMTTPMKPAVGRRPSRDYTTGSGYYAVVPSDLATIYNLNPAFAAGYTGLGRTIALIEDTDVYNYPSDWDAFRSTFGLSQQFPSGTFVQVHPGANCSDPGINGDDVEAALDVEWSSAAAPNAAIELASCFDTATNFGGFIALEGLLSEQTPPDLVSISYGESEVEYGSGGSAACNSTLGNGTAGSCVFYDETLGDMDTDCLPLNGTSYDCFMSNGNLGVLSTSNESYQPAYGTTTGWDFATGIGTVNAYNLVVNWPTSGNYNQK